MSAAGNGNCDEEESIPLMLIEFDAVPKVLWMYCCRSESVSLRLQSFKALAENAPRLLALERVRAWDRVCLSQRPKGVGVGRVVVARAR